MDIKQSTHGTETTLPLKVKSLGLLRFLKMYFFKRSLNKVAFILSRIQ